MSPGHTPDASSKKNPLIDEFGDEPDFDYTDEEDYLDYQDDMEQFFGRKK